jgi:hypothetical protein
MGPVKAVRCSSVLKNIFVLARDLPGQEPLPAVEHGSICKKVGQNRSV